MSNTARDVRWPELLNHDPQSEAPSGPTLQQHIDKGGLHAGSYTQQFHRSMAFSVGATAVIFTAIKSVLIKAFAAVSVLAI